MQRRQKLQASVVFLLAAFAVGAGMAEMIIRIIVNNYDLSKPETPLLGVHGYDDMGVISILLFWSYMEMGVGFVVACLLPCKKFIDILGEGLRSFSVTSLLRPRRSSSRSAGSESARMSSETYGTDRDQKASMSPDEVVELDQILRDRAAV